MYRVTGRVVRVDHKSGIKNEGTPEARAWGFDVIRVLVAEQDIVEVQRFKDNHTPAPVVGQSVDYAVTIDTYRGRVSAQLDRPFHELLPPVVEPVPADGYDYPTELASA